MELSENDLNTLQEKPTFSEKAYQNYLLAGENQQELTLKEDSVFVRVLDAMFANIPCIGCCSGL